jgi:adenylate cyclase
VFTDLNGFTAVAEELDDPIKVSELLIEYFTKTSRCILENQGTIIKYIGDAVMAAWGAPVADADHACNAALAAWQLREASKLVVGGRVLTTRVGLSTGTVAAGNLGSPYRFDYTVVGDTVNLASRLEGLNKMLETSILISEATCHRLDDRFVTRLVGHFAVAGKTHSIPVHELLCPRTNKTGDFGWISTFDKALRMIKEGDFTAAGGLLRQTVWERGGRNGPSEFYMRKLVELEKCGDLRTWTGVVNLAEKH